MTLAQADLDQGRVQPHRQRGELADRLLGPRPGLLPRCRAIGPDDLGEQADLAVGGGAEGAQVPALEPEPGQLGDDLGDGERVVVVVAAGLRGDQPELLELAAAARCAGRRR